MMQAATEGTVRRRRGTGWTNAKYFLEILANQPRQFAFERLYVDLVSEGCFNSNCTVNER